MKLAHPGPLRNRLVIAAATLAAAALSGLAFAGWFNHGNAILMSMVQTGLSWCF